MLSSGSVRARGRARPLLVADEDLPVRSFRAWLSTALRPRSRVTARTGVGISRRNVDGARQQHDETATTAPSTARGSIGASTGRTLPATRLKLGRTAQDDTGRADEEDATTTTASSSLINNTSRTTTTATSASPQTYLSAGAYPDGILKSD